MGIITGSHHGTVSRIKGVDISVTILERWLAHSSDCEVFHAECFLGELECSLITKNGRELPAKTGDSLLIPHMACSLACRKCSLNI